MADELTPDRIRAIRLGLGLSRVDFGRRLGVSVYTVAAWESGARRPCCVQMRRVIARLEVRK